MSKQYDNTNRGSLFDNDKKEKETHPDFTGTINVEGKEFWLNGWKKTSNAGKRFFSLSVKPKGKPAEKQPDSSDEIPW